jgi:hypothetical protein
MPDEQVPRNEDTPQAPDEAASQETPAEDAPEVNWQERYENLQPEYTRATQEAAQYRQVLELARQGDPEALDYLGLSIAEEDDADEDDLEDFEDPNDKRIAQLEQVIAEQLQGQEQAQQQEAFQEFVDDQLANQLATIENEYGQLDDADAEFLLELAQAMPDENGVPDLIRAYAVDQDRLDAKREGWVSSKRSPQAPSGASPSSQPDLDDKQQRRDYMAQKVMEAQQSY